MKPRPFSAFLGKDCRRLALPAALWFASFAAYEATALWSEWGDNDHLLGLSFMLSFGCIAALYHLMIIVLTGSVILEDTPVGTTAFWLTRPLPRWKVLAEKFVLLAAIVLIPIVVQFGCIIAANLGSCPDPVQIAAWIGGALLWAVPEVLVIALFAVLAEGFGQLVITAVLTILAAAIVALIVIRTGLLRPFASHIGFMEAGSSLMTSRTWAADALGVILTAGLVTCSYLWRHPRGLRVGAGMIILGVILLPFVWSRNFVREWSGSYVEEGPRIWTQGSIASHYSASQPVVDTELVNANGLKGRIEPLPGPEGTVEFPEVLEELTVKGRTGGSTALEGTRVELAVGALGYPPAAVAALAPLRVIGQVSRDTTGTFAIQPEGGIAAFFDRLQPVALHASVESTVRRCQVSTALPLRIGAHARSNLRTWTVISQDAKPGRIRLELMEGSLATPLHALIPEDEQPETITSTGRNSTNRDRLVSSPASEVFALVNRARGEAIFCSEELETWNDRRAGYYRAIHQMDFQDPSLDEAWLQGAALVRLRMVKVDGIALGTFDAPIESR